MTNITNSNFSDSSQEEIDVLCTQLLDDFLGFNSKAIACLNCRVPATQLCVYCNHGLAIQ
jgi:hypothetical protein